MFCCGLDIPELELPPRDLLIDKAYISSLPLPFHFCILLCTGNHFLFDYCIFLCKLCVDCTYIHADV